MSNEVEQIEAILSARLRVVVAKSGGIERAVGIDGARQAAMEIAALRSQDREDEVREQPEFRVGRRVPRNVYRGDAPVFMAATEVEATEMVALLNAGRAALLLSSVRTETPDA